MYTIGSFWPTLMEEASVVLSRHGLVFKVTEEFNRRRNELEDLEVRERDGIVERAGKPLRIGAMCSNKRSRNGSHFFHGDVCHVAVYLLALPLDTVRAHHMTGMQAISFDCDRLYALASAKFHSVLESTKNDDEIIARYSKVIANRVELESTQVREM